MSEIYRSVANIANDKIACISKPVRVIVSVFVTKWQIFEVISMFTTLISLFSTVSKLVTSTYVPYMYPTIIDQCVFFLEKLSLNILATFLISMLQISKKKQCEVGSILAHSLKG